MRMLFRLSLFRSITGLRYAIDVFLGTLLIWLTFRSLGDRNPVWAIISLIVVCDPDISVAWPNFVSRFSNTLIGCTTGILGLFIIGAKEWLLAPLLASTILICTSIIKRPGSWKIAPATSALILTSALAENSSLIGFEQAFHRVAEVLFGSLVALLVSVALSKIFPHSFEKKNINKT